MIPALGEKDSWNHSGQCILGVFTKSPECYFRGKRRVVSFFDDLKVLRLDQTEIHQFDPEEETFVEYQHPGRLSASVSETDKFIR